MANITALQSMLVSLSDRLAMTTYSVDLFYTQANALSVFMMQTGFSFLEAGCVETKNVTNILMKNFIVTLIGGLTWYLFGFAFAFGATDDELTFIGNKYFALSSLPYELLGQFRTYFFFQFTFAAASTSIVSGSLAGRCRFLCFAFFAMFSTAWIYPVIVHWVWSSSGWLSASAPPDQRVVGVIDYSGSGVVHLVGGTSAVIGAFIIGPRMGRFDADWEGEKPGTLRTFRSLWSGLGAFLLWYGWYGFNPGSSLHAIGYSDINALAAINTTLGGCSGAIAAVVIQFIIKGNWDLGRLLNGLLAGLVSVTGGCGTLTPWGSIITGMVGGSLYYGASVLCLKIQLDDPIEASEVHFVNGLWGMLSTGLLSDEHNVNRAFAGRETGYGLFMGGGGKLLGAQVLAIVMIICWASFWSGLFFGIANYFGYMRVGMEVEKMGLDLEHVEMTEQQKRLLEQGPFKYDKKKHSGSKTGSKTQSQETRQDAPNLTID